MSLESAQSQFLDLMRSLPNANTQKLFGDWIKRVVLPELEQQVEVEQNIVSARIRLNQISSYLSSVVPVEAVLPSEQIQFPSQGNKHTKHDTHTVNQRKKGTIFQERTPPSTPSTAFMWTHSSTTRKRKIDWSNKERSAEPTASNADPKTRNPCVRSPHGDATGVDTFLILSLSTLLGYITHSCSKSRLEFIFTRLLPPLDPSKRILDVGSRLGSVLFGAYLYTPANQIYGIEINKDFCDLQQATVEKYQMQQRIQVRPQLFLK